MMNFDRIVDRTVTRSRKGFLERIKLKNVRKHTHTHMYIYKHTKNCS